MDTATINFDDISQGTLPPAWVAGVTGKGAPRWSVEPDPTAPSAPNVLRQSGSGTFPWCVKRDVARANALENNVSLYYTEGGARKTIKYVDAPVAGGKWHTLRIEYAGTHIKVIFDGQARIELDDAHISGPGAVGVWTKADSVTAFDDFRYGSLR